MSLIGKVIQAHCHLNTVRTNYRATEKGNGNVISNPIGCWYGNKTTMN